MWFLILWLFCTIAYEVIYHTFFRVYYMGQDGCLPELARGGAIGLFAAAFIANVAVKHPFIVGIAVLAIAILLLNGRRRT